MKKIILCLLILTTLLTSCFVQKESNNGEVSNKEDSEIVKVEDEESDDKNSNNNSESKEAESSDKISSNTINTNLNDMDIKVKEYILNGQGDKSEAEKLKWSKRFLEQEVDFEKIYDNYLADGGSAEDVEWFARYVTLYAPILSNWQDIFKEDLLDIYGENVVKIVLIEGDLYQAYVEIEGKEVPYVTVSARTGYFHG